MYILVLEDDPILCNDLFDALSILKVEIKEARNAADAFYLINEVKPAAALLDYNLASGTSAAVAALLSRDRVPIGYVTADAEAVRKDPRIPACPIVGKPYRVGDIVDLAMALLSA